VWTDDRCTPAEALEFLTASWLRRKKFEARLLAVEVVNALSEAMGDGEGGDNERVSADAMLGLLGA
jgi:hypothetical protein